MLLIISGLETAKARKLAKRQTIAIYRIALNDFAFSLNYVNNQHAGIYRRNSHEGLPRIAV